MNAFIGWFVARALLVAGILVGITAALILRTSDWRKFGPWCKNHAQVVTGAGVGFCAGAFAVLLFGTEPTDAIAGLIGAFAGIVAAIGGGLWLWQVQDSKSVARTMASVDNACGFLAAGLQDMSYRIACGNDVSSFIAQSKALIDALNLFRSGVNRFESHLIETEANFQDQYAALELQLHILEKRLRRYVAHAPKREHGVGSEEQIKLKTELEKIHEVIWTIRDILGFIAPHSCEGWPATRWEEAEKIRRDNGDKGEVF